MQSITSKLAIIILSLCAIVSLTVAPAQAFDKEAVCNALFNSMYAPPQGVGPLGQHCGSNCSMGNLAYASDVVTRDTGFEDPNGEACGTIHFWSGPGTATFGATRQCSGHGLGCSGETCHVGKEWGECNWNGYNPHPLQPLIDGKPYCTAKKVVRACHGLKGEECGESRINLSGGRPAIQCKLQSDGVCTDGGGECTP